MTLEETLRIEGGKVRATLIRLTGGPGTSSCLDNSEQMGEGWSDYFGMMLTMQAGDLATDARGVLRGVAAHGIGEVLRDDIGDGDVSSRLEHACDLRV